MGEALRKLPGMARTVLWAQPTPIERLDNVSEQSAAENIWVKRDDCNGLAFGGNKVRQMEYYIGDALQQGADTLLITGAVQSNFVRTAAAACAKHGLQCHVQLENRVAKDTPIYQRSGNVLLDHMLGATIHHYPDGEDEAGADANLETIAAELRSQGHNPYIVHLHPTHPPFGALGYIDAAAETLRQIDEMQIQVDTIIIPSGSGNTHAGFVYGMRALGSSIPVIGSCVRRSAELQRPRLEDRLRQIAELLEEEPAAGKDDIVLNDTFLAPGYGLTGPETREAIALAAKREALILDPVYTGKTFANVLDHASSNPGCNLLFIHTGGTPAIFGYGDAMLEG